MNEPDLAPWQQAWRTGFAPQFSRRGLEAMKHALEVDDERLLQGATTSPPPLSCVQDWPCEGACAVAFAGWQGEGHGTVSQVEEYFASVCVQGDQALGEPGGGRAFLHWYDATPRDEMRRLLLLEVERALKQGPKTPAIRKFATKDERSPCDVRGSS